MEIKKKVLPTKVILHGGLFVLYQKNFSEDLVSFFQKYTCSLSFHEK